MTKMLASPVLARLLRAQSDAILTRTVEDLRSQVGSHYQERSVEELRSWVAASLSDLIQSLEEGSPQPMMDRAETLSRERGEMGFAIYEVVEGILSLKEAALPSILDTGSATARSFQERSWTKIVGLGRTSKSPTRPASRIKAKTKRCRSATASRS